MPESEKSTWRFRPKLDQVPRDFHSLETLEKWVKDERDFWNWLAQPASRLQPLNQLWNGTQSTLSQLLSLVSQRRKSQQEEERKQLDQQIQGALDRLATGGIQLTSADKRSRFAAAAAEEDPVLGAHIVLAFVQPQSMQVNSSQAVRALTQAEVFRHAISRKGVAARREALENTEGQWKDVLQEALDEYEGFREEFDQLSTDIDAARTKQHNEFAQLKDGWQDKLEEVETTFNEKLALQAPVAYWQDKATEHKSQARWRTLEFVCGLVVVGGLLWFLADRWLRPVLEEAQGPDYWPFLVVFLGLAGLLIWPIRILSRSLLSHMHLKTDAEERVTMANTYLSLLRSPEGLPEGDRRLILDALFRSASTGIVRDDAYPPSVMSAAHRLVSGDKG